jgi:hypothetical protein
MLSGLSSLLLKKAIAFGNDEVAKLRFKKSKPIDYLFFSSVDFYFRFMIWE